MRSPPLSTSSVASNKYVKLLKFFTFTSVTLASCFLILLIDLSSMKYFHSDEVNFIRVSKFSFNTFFIDRNVEHEGWSRQLRTYGRENPQIAKYFMGVSLWLHGYDKFDGIIEWNNEENLEWHIEQGKVPSANERFAGRLPIALLSALTAAMVGSIVYYFLTYLVRSEIARWLGGLAGAAIFLSNPVIWKHSHRAMPDMPALFFSGLAICLLISTLRSHLNKQFCKAYLYSAFCALAVGLAIASKLNAALTGMSIACIFFVIYLIEARLNRSSRSILIKRWLPHALLWSVLPAGIFILSNPFLYENTLENMETMRSLSDQVTSRRERISSAALYSLQERVGSFMHHVTLSVKGFSRYKLLLANLLIIGAGLVIMLARLYQCRSRLLDQDSVVSMILLVWTVVSSVGVLWWTPLSWDRYYAPCIPALSVLSAISIAWIFDYFIGLRSESNVPAS